jgi:aminoglycoside 6'-N-acetyltransferase
MARAEPADAPGAFVEENGLGFRPVRDLDQDFELMATWLGDDRVAEWFGGRDRPRSQEALREKYGRRIRSGSAVVPTFMIMDGRPIGFLQYFHLADIADERPHDYGYGTGEGVYGIDLFIGEPALWNQGIGTRAVRLIVRWLFEERGAGVVVADPRVANGRAIHCFEKAGIWKVRVLPGHERYEGRDEDCWLLEVVG